MNTVLILGFGVSGRAAAKLAKFSGEEVIVVDERDTPAVHEAAKNYTLLAGWKPGTPLPKADLAVISPGISIFSPLAEAVRKNGTPIEGELEYASRSIPCPVVAITGTNGKTTTTELTTELLRAVGFACESAGNIGTALCEAVLNLRTGGKPLDFLVVETSSFQLESVNRYTPHSAALLNLASDHINRHKTYEGYVDAKFRLFRNMNVSEHNCVVNANVLPEWGKRYPEPENMPTTFSAKMDADFHLCGSTLCFRNNPVFDWRNSRLTGGHNIENVLASLALLRSVAGDAAVFSEKVRNALADFRPDAHRLECFEEKNGIRYIDDSKATNPHSVNAALKTLGGTRRTILLLGGLDKDMDFSAIADDADLVKCAFLYGQCAEKILNTLGKAFPCTLCGTFEEAVGGACSAAVPGDAVALSPACASMDMFPNYAVRGDRFKELVREQLAKDRKSL